MLVVLLTVRSARSAAEESVSDAASMCQAWRMLSIPPPPSREEVEAQFVALLSGSQSRDQCSSLSRGGLELGPGGGLVVGGVGLEAAGQDADEAVTELPKGGLVADAAFAQGVVVGAGTG
jgi:hypothetical protein